MSNTPARPCTTTALLWQNALSWTSTPSATCLSTGTPSACGLQSLVETAVPGGSASTMGEANEPRSECPINAAIEVFGDRWSLIYLAATKSP
jgi:hypothetical protein